MTAPRKPQDHLPKKKTSADGRTVIVQGFGLDISPESLDDFELLDDLNQLDEGGSSAAFRLPRVLRAFLGAEQYKQVMDHLRDPDTGRVSIEAGVGFVGDLLKELSEADPNS